MRKAGLMAVLAGLALVARAEPPPEPVEARIEAVNVVGRELVAAGVTWGLSGTAAIRVPGVKRPSLRDLEAGMNVRLVLVAGDVPVVSSITVLPD